MGPDAGNGKRRGTAGMNMNEILRRDLIGIINECRRVMEQAELELALLEEGEKDNKGGDSP